MRMPWQPTPGYVRISRKALIGLQQDALRSLRLEAEIVRHADATARLEAARDAYRVLSEVDTSLSLLDASSNDLPMRPDGSLHDEALRAVADARIWAHRERTLANLVSKENPS
jgi:hypothetical protein